MNGTIHERVWKYTEGAYEGYAWCTTTVGNGRVLKHRWQLLYCRLWTLHLGYDPSFDSFLCRREAKKQYSIEKNGKRTDKLCIYLHKANNRSNGLFVAVAHVWHALLRMWFPTTGGATYTITVFIANSTYLWFCSILFYNTSN